MDSNKRKLKDEISFENHFLDRFYSLFRNMFHYFNPFVSKMENSFDHDYP